MINLSKNSRNFNQNPDSEFLWVIKVLKSSKTNPQISSCQKLFHNFLNKWDDTIKSGKKYKMMIDFNQEKQSIKQKISKKVDF
jgi:hypothetical protein